MKNFPPSSPQELTLTEWEWRALRSRVNLADGHARQPLSNKEESVIARASDIYGASLAASQDDTQRYFAEVFFRLAGQKSVTEFPSPLFHYSSSVSIEIVANYLRVNSLKVALVCPTFDNIPAIFRRHGVTLSPVSEDALDDLDHLDFVDADALFVVLPNNPTGACVTEQWFRDLCEYASGHKLLLIFDFSFRFFGTLSDWDQYAILSSCGTDFVAIEDTGKTFSLQDCKVGLAVSSRPLHLALDGITNDFLLNVSPFQLLLLGSLIESSNGLSELTARAVAAENWMVLNQFGTIGPLHLEGKTHPFSVAWLRLPKGWNASRFAAFAEGLGVAVLPGRKFYWCDEEEGESYIRIALMRAVDYFREGMDILTKAIVSYN